MQFYLKNIFYNTIKSTTDSLAKVLSEVYLEPLLLLDLKFLDGEA